MPDTYGYESTPLTEADLNWTSTGEEPFGAVRDEVLAAINSIEWRPIASTWPMAPGLAIEKVIAECRIPKVGQAGISGKLVAGRYEVLGIEGEYSNGVARCYVVDRGSDLVIVASHLTG